ncbi:hypothetical protein BGX27_006148 [Mortierella sp. AM989]|nr:hypothetical protein BGX27_006148 [Mortierella sp. AM989]
MVSQYSIWDLFQTPKQQQPQRSLEYLACSKALAIPEILGHILGYLSRYFIRNVIILVCKQWLSAARLKSPLKIDWAMNLTTQEHQHILQVLPSAQALSLLPYGTVKGRICATYPEKSYRDTIWKELLQAIQDIRATDEGTKLQEVAIRGELLNDRYFHDLLLYQPRISVLKLTELGKKPTRDFLHKIFTACPTLHELHVECWNFSRSYTPVKNEDEGENSMKPFPTIPLRTLVISGLIISPTCLESIVEAAPELVELRLIGAWRQRVSLDVHPFTTASNGVTVNYNPLSTSAGVIQNFDHSAFFRLVARTCRHLRRFHFSVHDQHYTQNDFATLLECGFPVLSERSFSHHDLPLLMKMITPSPSPNSLISESGAVKANPPTAPWDCITHLELIPLFQFSEVDGCSLHDYLCTAFHLKHLVAPRVQIDIANIRVSSIGQLDYTQTLRNNSDNGSNGRPTDRRKIWACRNLQTLHITFKGTIQEFAARSTSVSIFGYISIVCPQLVDLQIRGSSMNLTQSGGLCLLSRLRNLGKLTVSSKKWLQFSKHDVTWIRPYPPPINKLKAMLTGLKSQPQHEHQLTATIRGGSKIDNNVESTGLPIQDFVDSVVDWPKIERANNLEEWAKERDLEARQGIPCLPQLEHLQLFIDAGVQKSCRQAEQFMTEIRPLTKIELRYKKF